MIRGECLCKAVQYTIRGKPIQINLCHCKMCQQFSGSAFGAFIRIRAEDYELTTGAEQVGVYRSSTDASRSFCKSCGSSLEYINHSVPEYRFVAAGTLIDNPGIAAHHHIFTKDKACWFDIDKPIPQFRDWQSSVANNIKE